MTNRKLNIYLIGPTHPYRGGISHYTTLLYEYLKKGNNVKFISFSRQYPKLLFPGKTDIDPSQSAIKADGVQRCLDSMNPLTWLNSAFKIITDKPDMLIIPWWVAFWTPQFFTISALVKMFTKTKILFICHNVVEHESSFIKKFLTKLVLKRGDHFIVHSKEDMENLNQIIKNPDVKLNFHPTYEVFNDSSQSLTKQQAKQSFNLKDDNQTILFFGFVRPYKGLKYLIEAMPKIISANDKIRLIIAGEFWKDKDTYIDLIQKLRLTDYVIVRDEYIPNESIPRYFAAADMVAIPYTSATGSGIVQMAYGFEKPVVVTNVGCLPEVVQDGKTGYVIQPQNPIQLAQAILKTLEDNKFLELQQNIAKEKHKFSWEYMTDVITGFITS